MLSSLKNEFCCIESVELNCRNKKLMDDKKAYERLKKAQMLWGVR